MKNGLTRTVPQGGVALIIWLRWWLTENPGERDWLKYFLLDRIKGQHVAKGSVWFFRESTGPIPEGVYQAGFVWFPVFLCLALILLFERRVAERGERKPPPSSG